MERVSAARPLVSVILPAYNSHDTIAACLQALAGQTFQDFETLVVDSGPDGSTARIVGESFPRVRFVRSACRLLPHAARSRGVEISRGELLVFTDPDVYARPDWLERLVEAHRRTGEVIVGSLACHGGRWLDRGIHLCKFSKWLPGGEARAVDMSPTANMLISRRQFETAGGIPGDSMLGDVTLSRLLRQGGRRLWFEPRAAVEHHHLQSLADFLRERYTRGKMFGGLRLGWLGRRRGPSFTYLAVTVLPVRLARILALVALHAWRAGQTGWYLATLPLVAAGHAASLAGEAVAYSRRLMGFTPHPRGPAAQHAPSSTEVLAGSGSDPR